MSLLGSVAEYVDAPSLRVSPPMYSVREEAPWPWRLQGRHWDSTRQTHMQLHKAARPGVRVMALHTVRVSTPWMNGAAGGPTLRSQPRPAQPLAKGLGIVKASEEDSPHFQTDSLIVCVRHTDRSYPHAPEGMSQSLRHLRSIRTLWLHQLFWMSGA